MLLLHGADVNRVDRAGKTALHYGAWNDLQGVVGVLIKGGADVGKADNKGWASLHYAMEHGHAGTVELLLAQPGVGR